MKIDISDDPRSIVLAIESLTKKLCLRAGADPAEAIMIHLTVAALIAWRHSNKPVDDLLPMLSDSLVDAVNAADGWFGLSENPATAGRGVTVQ